MSPPSKPLILFFLLFACTSGANAASPCTAITDDKSRLQCYDAEATKAPPAAKPADPLFEAAKTRVKAQLRDPASAHFQNLTTKTIGTQHGVCGEVNAKNAMGGMTGFIPFAYDGKFAYLMSFNAGPGNPTSLSPDIWAVTLGTRLSAYEKWCKRK